MPSRDFYFLRHGETDWNIESRLQGHTDIALNDNGRAQAVNSIPALRNLGIQRIVSSPLSRAHETAQIVNQVLGLPLTVDERLKEKHFGMYEGMARAEILEFEKTHPKEELIFEPETGFPRPPGAEVYNLFHTRVFDCVRETLNTFPDEKILFVSHGGVYRALCRHLFGGTDHSPNAQPFRFKKNADAWVLEKLTLDGQ